MRQEVFGMRRANGDWFVLEAAAHTRVLVFRDLTKAWRVRALNSELMLFWPTPIDEHTLAEFASADKGGPVSFWLIDEEDTTGDLQRGHPLEYMQLATIEHVREVPLKSAGKAHGQAAGKRR